MEPFPVPANFPFEWDEPAEARHFWTVDLMHWPHGISPLAGTMDLPAFCRGLNKAVQTLRMPLAEVRFKPIRGYVFTSFVPYSTDRAQMDRRTGEMMGEMGKHIPGLLDRWYEEYEPEVRSINSETLHGDYGKLGDADIADLLETLVAKREREGELHFLAVFPAGGAVMFFEQVYTNLFGEPEGAEHLQLLQGFPNKSVESDTALWRLALEAKGRPPVARVLAEAEPARVDAALAESEEGRSFRGAVEEYLDAYGWRSNELDIAEPTWKEDPTTVYKIVHDYLHRDDYDPEAEFKSLVAARKGRERVLMDRLTGPGQVEMFQQALSGAQQYLPVQEDHNFWIDQQGSAVQRVPVLEAGRRLQARGVLADASDVFFLHYDELQDLLRGKNGNALQMVTLRRREQAGWRASAPPPVLGTPLPPEVEENPMAGKFFGGQPPESPDPRIINGNGASPGSFTGTARVIMSLDESDRLSPGEVLVCPATMPPWTPLFGIAAAVVTDHGGVLSHTAIVAREYRIPAVVGTKVGTGLIEDGQTVTVDGGKGTVKLEG
jgi:pyruvate,water dikinase